MGQGRLPPGDAGCIGEIDMRARAVPELRFQRRVVVCAGDEAAERATSL